MAHGRADILAYQAGSGARGRRTETAQTTGVAECGNYDRQGDDQCALAAGVGSTAARLSLHAAAADDLCKPPRHLRIELLLTPWADATPTFAITSSQAK
jgi:hypothetical protein